MADTVDERWTSCGQPPPLQLHNTNATWCLLGALFKNRLLHVVVLLQLVFYWRIVLDKLKLPKVFQTHSSTQSILVPVLAFREHCPRMGTLSSSNSPVKPYPVKPCPCRSINGLWAGIVSQGAQQRGLAWKTQKWKKGDLPVGLLVMLTLLRSQLSQGKNRRVDSSRELTQKIVDKLHTTKSFLHHLLTNILRRINFWQQNLMSQSHMKSPPVPSEEVRFRTVKSRLMLGEVPLLLPIVGYCRTYQLPPCLLLPTITATIVGFYFYFCRLLLTAIIGYYCKSL